MRASVFFRFTKWLCAKALYGYFSKIEIIGEKNIPKSGPFILACNHQNAFLDAIIVGALLPRNLYFLTRSDVFNSLSTYWLKKLQMIPIYRIRDGFSSIEKNQEIFEKCKEVFKFGKSVMIFPEGNHGECYHLRSLTKGTARIAFYANSKLDSDLKIIPCGLNFFSHLQPRNKLLIAYGKPISVGTFQNQFQKKQTTSPKELNIQNV